MYLKRMLFTLIFFSLFLFNCNEKNNPVTSENLTYETSFGLITQIDNNPAFTLNYSSDYKFDEYLETEDFPFFSSTFSNKGNFACTCFSAFGGSNRLLGRNYDWPDPSTYYILFTDPPDGYSSVSTVDLTFFSYNHDKSPDFANNLKTLQTLPYFPFDGMNEKGVTIGMNAIDNSETPYDASKVTIGELQLIRLVLDYASSTKEAVTLIQQYNIRMEDPPIHYLIADSSGHSVIVEFVNGKMEIMNNINPWQVTTNFVITGSDAPQNAPCWRYKTAYETLSNNNGILSINEVANLLNDVSVPSTRWSTVFNLKSGQLQIAFGRDYNNFFHYAVH